MAFLGTQKLSELLDETDVIIPFDKKKLKNGTYELSLGSQVFQTGSKPRIVKSLTENEKIYIEPGQFALLLTQEKVKIPKNKLAFISIKASVKFNGLVNVSGFHVDPGFEGQLLYSVYNAGPSTIVLSQGTSYFPIWFAELGEYQEYHGNHKGQNQIPDDPVKALSQGEVASPNELSKRIEEQKHLKTKIEWVFLAIVTLLIGLTVRLWTENSKLKEAVEFGYTMKTEEIFSDSIYKRNQMEINRIDITLDSLRKVVQPISKPKK